MNVLGEVINARLTDNRHHRLGRSKEIKEASEGSTECTMYMSTERAKLKLRFAYRRVPDRKGKFLLDGLGTLVPY